MSADMVVADDLVIISQPFSENHDKTSIVVPVGLDFGPSNISIAFCIDSTDEAVMQCYTSWPCGQVYRDFYEEALSKKVRTHLEFEDLPPSAAPLVPTEERASELVQAFSLLIEDARLEGVSARGWNQLLIFKVMAITVPDHWDVSARTVVAKAARVAGQPLDGSHMLVKLPRAVQSAHEMPRLTDGIYYTLLVYYHKSHLHLMLTQMHGTGFVMLRQVWLPHLGEDAIRKAAVVGTAVCINDEILNKDTPNDETLNTNSSSSDPSNAVPTSKESVNGNLPQGNIIDDTPLRDTTSYGKYSIGDIVTILTKDPVAKDSLDEGFTPELHNSTHSTQDTTGYPDDANSEPPANQYLRGDVEPILDALTKFILFTTPSDDSNAASNPSFITKYAVRDIKYIVIDGEASVEGHEALLTAIEDMYGDQDGISIEGNKRDCGAVGAEIAARRQIQNPQHFGDWKNLPGYVPGRAEA